jgi:hypothetical protein
VLPGQGTKAVGRRSYASQAGRARPDDRTVSGPEAGERGEAGPDLTLLGALGGEQRAIGGQLGPAIGAASCGCVGIV